MTSVNYQERHADDRAISLLLCWLSPSVQAFNEELDRMYEDAHLSTTDEVILAQRAEVRTSKAQRNGAEAKSRDLERKLRLQTEELEAFRKTLAENGLL